MHIRLTIWAILFYYKVIGFPIKIFTSTTKFIITAGLKKHRPLHTYIYPRVLPCAEYTNRLPSIREFSRLLQYNLTFNIKYLRKLENQTNELVVSLIDNSATTHRLWKDTFYQVEMSKTAKQRLKWYLRLKKRVYELRHWT
jgi:hypothetical protein